jgi:hypothetical protein
MLRSYVDIGSSLLKKCEELEETRVRVVEISDDGAWWLLRGAAPMVLVRELIAFADRHRNEFWNVHCVREGDISRIMLAATPAHKAELDRNGEGSVLCAHRDATILAESMGRCWNRVKGHIHKHFGVDIGFMVEPEISRSRPGSLGQVRHMDNVVDVISQLLCLKGGITAFAEYAHQKFPANVSAESTVPANWDTLKRVSIDWLPGDILCMYQSLIHWAPENASRFWRHLGFMGGSVLTKDTGNSFSDKEVFTEGAFKKRRRYCGVSVEVCVVASVYIINVW